MKNVALKLFSAGLLAISLTACPGVVGNTAEKGSGDLQGWPSSVEGKLEFVSYSPGEGAVVEASANINASGDFSYQLPNPPKSKLAAFGGLPECLNVSNTEAKTTSVGIVAYEGSSANASGTVTLATYDVTKGATVGGKMAAQGYVDRDVRITGTCTISGLTTEYDVSFKKGWNLAIGTVMEVNNSGQATKLKITAATNLSDEFKWWYVDYSPSQAARPKLFPQLN